MDKELMGILEKYIWKAMVGVKTQGLMPNDKDSLVKEAHSAIQEHYLGMLKEMKNPYPETIFKKITEDEWVQINYILKKHLGFTLDRVSGNIGREVWNSYISEMERKIRGEQYERKNG